MTTTTTRLGARALALVLTATGVGAHDGEWPPLPDPQWDGTAVIGNPDPTSALYLDRLELVIPNGSPRYADWVTHFHQNTAGHPGRYGGWKTDFAIGDVDNDGLADDIVITMPGEAAFAAKIDLANGTLTPLFLFLTPFAQSTMGGVPKHVPGVSDPPDDALNRNNPLIWNIVDDATPNDDTNEVAFVGLNDDGTQEQLFLLRHDPSQPGGFLKVAETPLSMAFEVDHRLGIGRVRNTAFPRDVVMTAHTGRVFVWSWEAGALVYRYKADQYSSNTPLLAKTHESTWADIDGDGFDEFFVNGLLDFVDAGANGQPVPTNPAHPDEGVARWQIVDATAGSQEGHTDQVHVADWDPTRPGLEVYAVTEQGNQNPPFWLNAQTGEQHFAAYDTLWDADCGTPLDEWTEAPATDGQNVVGGNWTRSHAGLEAIVSPKDLANGGQVIAPGQAFATGSYAVATRVTPSPAVADFELLTIEGALYDGSGPYNTNNALKIRSGGPWGRMFALDWDGDYATDEILHHPRNEGNLIVFRLGVKGDWGLGPLPPGLPTQAQVESPIPPIQGEGDDPNCQGPSGWWYFHSQGTCGEHIGPPDQPGTWSWNQGGPGRGTHYYQKLKEVFPNSGASGAVVAHPYDLAGTPDHREEIVAVSATVTGQSVATLHVYSNASALPAETIPRPTPHASLAYRAYRQRQVVFPFQFGRDAVAIQRFGVRPADASLPSRVVGVPFGGSVQLEAFVEFADGSETDVTDLVTWVQDAESASFLSLTSTGLVTEVGGITLSGRFHAELTLDGELRQSEPSYVFTSASNRPRVLRAGFSDSWLVDDPALEARVLRCEAYVAQRDNANRRVFVLDRDGTLWESGEGTVELVDDGSDGDAHAGDGIFTATVQDVGDLDAGDHLLAIRALLPPISVAAPPQPPILAGVANSDPWPYFVLNAAPTAPWPSADPPPSNATEENAFEAPRIASLGFRGWGVPGEALFEVEVIPPPLHPDVPILVRANFGGVWYDLTDQGNRIYSILQPTAGVPAGLYVPHVVAFVLDNGVFPSDPYPQLRVHTYPTWDLGEVPALPEFCYERLAW